MLAVHAGDERIRLLSLLPQQLDKLLIPPTQQGTGRRDRALLGLNDPRAVSRHLGDARCQLLR